MKDIYRIFFLNQGKFYELYAESVYQSEMYGFVVVEGLLFDQKASVLIDPAEEKLRDEFANVSRILVPIHSVVRVDEVSKKGPSKIHDADAKGNITPFPMLYSQPIQHPE
jgi:hypothetical protein